MTPLFIQNACVKGRRVDITVEHGAITRITPTGEVEPCGETLNANGGLVSRPFADPHIHLDAVLLGARTPNTSGTLQEGIANWGKARASLTPEDVRARAKQAISWCVAQGTTRIRTHADTASSIGVETLLSLREEVAEICDLQVVAFPQDGVFTGEGHEAALRWAAAAGVDAIGAIPHHEHSRSDGENSLVLATELAEQHGVAIDIHCDETDDPNSRHLEFLCRHILKTGFSRHVVAGHCTAMHSYPDDYANEVIALVVKSGVQVVANPLDNVVLQGRHDGYPRRRGITRVPELLEAGAAVGCGHDSIQDPWYPLGRGALLEAASMLVHVAQMTRPEQVESVFNLLVHGNHAPFGGIPDLVEGSPADLLVHSVKDAQAAIRLARAPRWVIRQGRVIAHTEPAQSEVLGQAVEIGSA
ncbi:MAG: amidohydrolase family protein [Myxococcota bacterium]|nr:amidohydrolase family protein [Myxococcota bacterium]